jgi:hypothetical protein
MAQGCSKPVATVSTAYRVAGRPEPSSVFVRVADVEDDPDPGSEAESASEPDVGADPPLPVQPASAVLVATPTSER